MRGVSSISFAWTVYLKRRALPTVLASATRAGAGLKCYVLLRIVMRGRAGCSWEVGVVAWGVDLPG